MPKIINPVFVKTSPKRSFSMTEYERFGLLSRKRGSINSGTGPRHKFGLGSVCIAISNTVKDAKDA